MKYIRTENGIYEVATSNEDDDIRVLIKKGMLIHKKNIIAQADTIEELCDGFYNDILGEGTFNFDGLYIYNDFESFKDDWKGYRTYDNWQGNGYGFIKTSKGLIYVAKMNSEGKLCLI